MFTWQVVDVESDEYVVFPAPEGISREQAREQAHEHVSYWASEGALSSSDADAVYASVRPLLDGDVAVVANWYDASRAWEVRVGLVDDLCTERAMVEYLEALRMVQ